MFRRLYNTDERRLYNTDELISVCKQARQQGKGNSAETRFVGRKEEVKKKLHARDMEQVAKFLLCLLLVLQGEFEKRQPASFSLFFPPSPCLGKIMSW